MQTQINTIRFIEGRKHLFVKHKKNRKGLSEEEIYLRKKAARLKRAAELAVNGEQQLYIDWIFGIQKKLRLSTPAFASRIGVKVQMVRLWRRRIGHFPSERSFRNLLKLERLANIPVTITKHKIGIRKGNYGRRDYKQSGS